MTGNLHELEIPCGQPNNGDAVEFVRFWIADGQDHVSLKVGRFDPENEAKYWGHILADITKHVVRGLQQSNPELGSPEQLVAEIEVGFRTRLQQNVDITGQINGTAN